MNVTFNGNYTRCIKKFTKLPIIPKLGESSQDNATKYFIFSKDKKNIIGCFDMEKDGFIYNLKLAEKVRRKQEACNAILSLKEFVVKKAKEKNLDFVKFYVSVLDKNHCARLYKKLGADFTHIDDNGKSFIGVIKPEKKAGIIQKIIDSVTVKINPGQNKSFIEPVK